MKIKKLIVLGISVVMSCGCTPLTKTGKFVWRAPGKIVSGALQTGKFAWNITPKSGPQLQEAAKFIWGSSTKSLENARVTALKKTYRCSFNDCYDSVLTLTRKKRVVIPKYTTAGEALTEEEEESEKLKRQKNTGVFDIFNNNRAQKYIVVMGIQGNVETTEVGIFFSQPSLTTVKLEISSLSSNAKRKIAEAIFNELDLRFSAVE